MLQGSTKKCFGVHDDCRDQHQRCNAFNSFCEVVGDIFSCIMYVTPCVLFGDVVESPKRNDCLDAYANEQQYSNAWYDDQVFNDEKDGFKVVTKSHIVFDVSFLEHFCVVNLKIA